MPLQSLKTIYALYCIDYIQVGVCVCVCVKCEWSISISWLFWNCSVVYIPILISFQEGWNISPPLRVSGFFTSLFTSFIFMRLSLIRKALITDKIAEQQTFQFIILYSKDSTKLSPQGFKNTNDETKIKIASNKTQEPHKRLLGIQTYVCCVIQTWTKHLLSKWYLMIKCTFF